MTTRSPLRPYPMERAGWAVPDAHDARTLPPGPTHQSHDNKGVVRDVPGSSGDLPSVWRSLPDIASRSTPREGPATRSAIGHPAPHQRIPAGPESSPTGMHATVTSIPPPSRMPTHGASTGISHQYQILKVRQNSRGGYGAISPVLGEGAGGGSAHSSSRTLQMKMQGPDVAAALKAFSEEMQAQGTPLQLDSLAGLAGTASGSPAQPTSDECRDDVVDEEEPTASVLRRSLDHVEERVLCSKVNQMLPRSPLHLGLHVKSPSSVVVQVPPSRHSWRQLRQGAPRPATQQRDALAALENQSVMASHDVGVQAAPLPWTRYFFPDKSAASSTTNSFFKHFDIMEVDPLPHDFPGGTVVDPLSEHLHQQWIRLYYSPILNKPAGSMRSWPMVSTMSHRAHLENSQPPNQARAFKRSPSHSSVPVGFSSKSAFREENIQLLDSSPSQEELRMELVDFIRYVVRLQPRTPEDLKPLLDLRLGLLHHLCDIIDNSHRKMYNKHKVKEHRMKKALQEEMDAFQARMKETLQDMSLSHENELQVMKLASAVEARIHSAWKEKSTEHTDNLLLKLELLEASETDLKQRVADLENKNMALETQLQSKSLEFDNLHENLKSKMREEIGKERRASLRKVRRMSHKPPLDAEGNEVKCTPSGSPLDAPMVPLHAADSLGLEEQLAASKALVAKLQSNANKYFEELRDTQGQLDQMKAAYKKRLKELEERHRVAQADTRTQFQQVLTSAIGTLTLSTGSAAAGSAFLSSVQRFNEEQKARNLSDYDRYQETMMLWDLEAENQLSSSHGRPKKASSSRGEFDPIEHRPAGELTAANMISSAQATRTGSMMQMKNQLAAMADQLNSTMSDLKGKDIEVQNLNNLLKMMQQQMRSAGTALENHVQVEQRILQEKIEKNQTQEEGDRQELLDQRIKLGQMSSQLQTLTHLPEEELGEYNGMLLLAMETAKMVATPADRREAEQAVEGSPSIDTLPQAMVQEPSGQALGASAVDGPHIPVARSNFFTNLQSSKELQTLQELCCYLRNENQALAESMNLVRSYMEEQLSPHVYNELAVACAYTKDRAQHPGEDAFHHLKTWELGTEGLGDVYDDTLRRVLKMKDEASRLVEKLVAKMEALSIATPVDLVDNAVAHLAAISAHLTAYIEPFNADKKQQAFPLPSTNKSDAAPSREHLEALWSLRDKPLIESMDALVLLEDTIDAIQECVQENLEEGAFMVDARSLLSQLMNCISKEQSALERLEPSLESHLRAAHALKRKAVNAVADYGRSELEVDSDVLAIEGLRNYACAYTLYMSLAAAQGTAWKRKEGEEVPRLMQLEESLRIEIEDKLAAQALLRETQDELVCLKNMSVIEEQDLEEAMHNESNIEPDAEVSRRSSSSVSMRMSVLGAGKQSSQSHPTTTISEDNQHASSGANGISDATPKRSHAHEDDSLPALNQEGGGAVADQLSTPLFASVGRKLMSGLAMTAPASMVRFADDSPMAPSLLHDRGGGERAPPQRQRLVPAGRSFRYAMSPHDSPKHSAGRHHVGRLDSESSARLDDEDEDAPPFHSPDTGNNSPAASQRRWRTSTVKVSNLFGAKDSSIRKKELSVDMLEGMTYLHKVAKDASIGDARAMALLHAQNRVAGLIIGSAALTGGYPAMGLDDEEGATLVRRLGKLMLDGAVDEDATAFQMDQKEAEIARLNAIIKQYAHSMASGPQSSPHPLQRSYTHKSSVSAPQTLTSFKMILKHPPEDVNYLAWLFSDEILQRVEGMSELKELMLAGLLYMQEEHSTHMYASTVVSDDGPLTKKPANHNKDFMQLVVVTPGCPLGRVGDCLPQDSTSAPYKAINSQRETSYVDRKTGRKIAIVPILVAAKNNESPAFSWGTIAYTVDARLTDDTAQLALEGRIMVRGLQKAVCRYLGHEETPRPEATTSGAQMGGRGWQRLASGGGALASSHTLSMQDLDDDTYKRFMTQKAVIEAMFSQDDKLKNMTVELKRYRIAPLAVAGVSAAVMVLLGDKRMMEMVRKGMPKNGSVAVQNIWVHAQKAFTGGNQKTGKGKWAKAIPGAVKELDIFERIKEFSFDYLTSEQLSAARLILEQVPEEAVIKASKVIAVLRNWAASVCGISSLLERGQAVETTTPVLDISNNM